jgi:hypothetical protein
MLAIGNSRWYPCQPSSFLQDLSRASQNTMGEFGERLAQGVRMNEGGEHKHLRKTKTALPNYQERTRASECSLKLQCKTFGQTSRQFA